MKRSPIQTTMTSSMSNGQHDHFIGHGWPLSVLQVWPVLVLDTFPVRFCGNLGCLLLGVCFSWCLALVSFEQETNREASPFGAKPPVVQFQGCGIKGFIPTSVLQGDSLPFAGELVFGKPFPLHHRSGLHFPQPGSVAREVFARVVC